MATQQQIDELTALIYTLIIDNNTNQVTPAKVRAVLFAVRDLIPVDGGSVSSITAQYPLVLDGFSGLLQFKTVPLKSFERIAKGWTPGTAPSGLTANVADADEPGDFFWGTDADGKFYLVTRWSGEGNKNDIANHIWTYGAGLYFPDEPGFEE